MKKLVLILLCFFVVPVYADQQIRLAWDIVTENIHGNIVEIRGYKIYSSQKSWTYLSQPNGFDVGNVTEYTLNLPDGIWFFVVTAYTTDAESSYSKQVANITIPTPPVNPYNLHLERNLP